jgi:hypothetical protein
MQLTGRLHVPVQSSPNWCRWRRIKFCPRRLSKPGSLSSSVFIQVHYFIWLLSAATSWRPYYRIHAAHSVDRPHAPRWGVAKWRQRSCHTQQAALYSKFDFLLKWPFEQTATSASKSYRLYARSQWETLSPELPTASTQTLFSVLPPSSLRVTFPPLPQATRRVLGKLWRHHKAERRTPDSPSQF